MRKIILLLLFFCPIVLLAQNLTGIWRGNFSQKDFNPLTGDFTNDNYKYEVQVFQKPDNSLDGVTYSYKKTEFYGKASLHGLANIKTKNIIIKEIRLIEHHSNNSRSSTCLMTCYLEYVKRGKLEILTGTYTSINTDSKNNNNCGEGTVYLEKVEESDFDEESFLSKKNHQHTSKPNSTSKDTKKPAPHNTASAHKDPKSIAKKDNAHTKGTIDNKTKPANNSTKNATAKVNTPHKNSAANTTGAIAKNSNDTKARIDSAVLAIKSGKIKPGAEKFVLKNKIDNEMDTFYKFQIDTTIYVYDSPNNKRSKRNNGDSTSNSPITSLEEFQKHAIAENQLPKPLAERENKLLNTIVIEEKDAKIDFYDKGEIDNDTISVYDNNKLIVNSGRLSNAPITLNLKFSDEMPVHEIITVAENLGDIPPNTALMVITCGKKRYEVFITSDEQRNAKVILKYKNCVKPK